MSIFRRFLLTVALVLLALVFVLGLFHLEENQRGARIWADAQRELRAKGEFLEWSHFIPPPIPAAQNLAFSPFYVRALHYRPDPKTGFYSASPSTDWLADLRDMPYGGTRPANLAAPARNPIQRRDLAAHAAYYRRAPGFPHPPQPGGPAADVLLALNRYGPALDELARAAAGRPLTRFPVDWKTGNPFMLALPHYILEQQLVTTLALRASARLAAGQSAAALDDLELSFRLCHDCGDEPPLIAHLVQSTCLRIVLVSVWEGLVDRRWSATELARLQADLQAFDVLADYQRAMRGERASAGIIGTDYLAHHLDQLPDLMTFGATPSASERRFYQCAGYFVPRGWFDQNKANIALFMQRYYVEGVDPAAYRAFPAKLAGSSAALAAIPNGPTTFLLKIGTNVYATVGERAAHVQCSLDEASAACALERFALDHPSNPPEATAPTYPATLSELVPAYLARVPTDLIDGAPLRYARPPDGRYRLYSIGWNGRDDGGRVVWYQSGNSLDDHQGDWVWQYAPLNPPSKLPGKGES